MNGRLTACSRISSRLRPFTRRPTPIRSQLSTVQFAAGGATAWDVRRRDDDLSLVAGITGRQRKALKSEGTRDSSWACCARCAPRRSTELSRVWARAFRRKREIQVEGEDAGEPRWELIEPERVDGELVPIAVCSSCPSRLKGTSSSTSRVPATTPRTGKSSGSSTCSASSTPPSSMTSGSPRYTAYWAFDRSGRRRPSKH